MKDKIHVKDIIVNDFSVIALKYGFILFNFGSSSYPGCNVLGLYRVDFK